MRIKQPSPANPDEDDLDSLMAFAATIPSAIPAQSPSNPNMELPNNGNANTEKTPETESDKYVVALNLSTMSSLTSLFSTGRWTLHLRKVLACFGGV